MRGPLSARMSALGRCRQSASFRAHYGCPLPDLRSPVAPGALVPPRCVSTASSSRPLFHPRLLLFTHLPPRPPWADQPYPRGLEKREKLPSTLPELLSHPWAREARPGGAPLRGLSTARLWASGLQSHPSPGTCLRNPPPVS